MQIGTLLMLGILALLGAAYRYYWYSASPPEPHTIGGGFPSALAANPGSHSHTRQA